MVHSGHQPSPRGPPQQEGKSHHHKRTREGKHLVGEEGVRNQFSLVAEGTTYRKVPKSSDGRKLCCNLPKIQTKRPNLRVFHQKDANGIANSEDPDQTAPLIWVCTVCPYPSVRKLKICSQHNIAFGLFVHQWMCHAFCALCNVYCESQI